MSTETIIGRSSNKWTWVSTGKIFYSRRLEVIGDHNNKTGVVINTQWMEYVLRSQLRYKAPLGVHRAACYGIEDWFTAIAAFRTTGRPHRPPPPPPRPVILEPKPRACYTGTSRLSIYFKATSLSKTNRLLLFDHGFSQNWV